MKFKNDIPYTSPSQTSDMLPRPLSLMQTKVKTQWFVSALFVLSPFSGLMFDMHALGRQVLISSRIYIYYNIKHNLMDLKPLMSLQNLSCWYAYEY